MADQRPRGDVYGRKFKCTIVTLREVEQERNMHSESARGNRMGDQGSKSMHHVRTIMVHADYSHQLSGSGLGGAIDVLFQASHIIQGSSSG